MRIFREFIFKIFAICVLAISITCILGSVELISLNKVSDIAITYLSSDSITVVLIASVVAILALIAIFTNSYDKDEIKSGIAIKREAGNVYIAKETFESIVANVAKSFASLKNYKIAVSITDQGIIANVYTYILPDAVVPTLTTKLQESIKDAILKQTTVELKEVNVKVKGVYTQPEKTTSQN